MEVLREVQVSTDEVVGLDRDGVGMAGQTMAEDAEVLLFPPLA